MTWIEIPLIPLVIESDSANDNSSLRVLLSTYHPLEPAYLSLYLSYHYLHLRKMSAPSSDPPPPNPTPTSQDAKQPDATASSSSTTPLTSANDQPSSTSDDVKMEDDKPKEDPLDDIPEGVLSVSYTNSRFFK